MISLLRSIVAFFLKGYMWLALVGLLVLGYIGYIRITPQVKTELLPSAERVVGEVVARIADSLPEPRTPTTLLVMPLANDRADHFLREKIAQGVLDSGKYQVIDKTFTEKAMDAVNLQLSREAAPTAEQARATARRLGADAVLIGEVAKFKQSPPAELRVAWRMLDSKGDADESLAAGSYASTGEGAGSEGSAGGGWFAHPRAPLNAGWALLVWVGSALLLPLFLAGVLSNFLAKESNLTNFATLFVLTAVNVGLALLLLGGTIGGLLDSALILAAAVAGGAYNYLLLDKLESMRP